MDDKNIQHTSFGKTKSGSVGRRKGASLQSARGTLTEQSGLSPENRQSSKKMLDFPPVAGPCVDVCGYMCVTPDGLITVASELSGMLPSHPPPHPTPILILQAMVQSSFRKTSMLSGPWP